MLCRYCFSLSAFCLVLTAFFPSDVRPQTHGYSAANSTVKLDRVRQLPAGTTGTTNKIEALLNALRFAPDDPVILNNLSVAYAAADQLDKAVEAGRRAVEINDGLAVVRVNLAIVYDRMGQIELAHAQAAEAARLEPENVRARDLFCELGLVLNRNSEAVKCYRDLNEDFPGRYDFQLNLGVALFKAGEYDTARALLEKLMAAHQRDPQVINILASVYYMRKDYERSTELLKTAVELDPDESRLRYNLGMSYLALKNRAGALSQYNLIKESDPGLAGKLYRSLFRRYILDVRK